MHKPQKSSIGRQRNVAIDDHDFSHHRSSTQIRTGQESELLSKNQHRSSCSNQSIKAIPVMVSRNKGFQIFKASNNRIVKLPQWSTQMPRLKKSPETIQREMRDQILSQVKIRHQNMNNISYMHVYPIKEEKERKKSITSTIKTSSRKGS